MTPITLPAWLIGSAIGLPTICLFWLIATLVRKKRKMRSTAQKSNPLAPLPENERSSISFHQDLCMMQIDTVFDGLTALIDTERLKLKRLMSGCALDEKIPGRQPDFRAPAPRDESDGPVDRKDSHDQKSDRRAISEQEIQQIASRLGVSAAEAELAMKFQKLSNSNGRHALEAVA